VPLTGKAEDHLPIDAEPSPLSRPPASLAFLRGSAPTSGAAASLFVRHDLAQ